jgi:GntR family transcriptional regulator, transcriptional repressor for pyruvate dehydrogenase complex
MEEALKVEKLQRETLAEQVARRLMDSIVSQGLRPGDALPSELQLSDLFRVSRPVIREGLRYLAALGVVEIANGKRAVVKPITADLLSTFFTWAVSLDRSSLVELHEVRRGIEGQSAALAAQRHTGADLAAMQAIVQSMREHLHDPDAYADLDVRLHLAIAAATQNTLLRHLVESIREAMAETVRRGLGLIGTEREMRMLQDRHEAIVAVIERRDADAARREMELHLTDALRRLIAAGLRDAEIAPRQSPSPLAGEGRGGGYG